MVDNTTECSLSIFRDALEKIHADVHDKYYGCGLCLPEGLWGCTVLDLGCGAGRDCYLASHLVGPAGKVIGLDCTESMLAVAKRTMDFHAKQFGFANVDFRLGSVENLDSLLEPNSVDVIISNCVINLSPDKEKVLRGCHSVLKPGGELYFADVYASRRVPRHLHEDATLWGECLAGALYWNDFLHLAKSAGFRDPRLVADRRVEIANDGLEALVAPVAFFSATYRLFKLADLEPSCEDYGQAVMYRGGLAHTPTRFELDQNHTFETGKVVPVCGNTRRMLHQTRFAPHFAFLGTGETHYGIDPSCAGATMKIPFQSARAGPPAPSESARSGTDPAACCS